MPRAVVDGLRPGSYSFRIKMIGEQVTIHLNEKLVVDNARLENYFNRSNPVPAKGPIQLQTHGGEISWRNIYLKELTPKSD